MSVGIGPTKVLAKTANHYAKKVPENQGIFILDSPEKVQDALKIFAIDEVWGDRQTVCQPVKVVEYQDSLGVYANG